MTESSAMRVEHNDGTYAVIPPGLLDTIPTFVAIGMYVQIIAAPNGVTERDLVAHAHPNDDPRDMQAALTDLADLDLIDVTDTPRGTLYTAKNVEVIA